MIWEAVVTVTRSGSDSLVTSFAITRVEHNTQEEEKFMKKRETDMKEERDRRERHGDGMRAGENKRSVIEAHTSQWRSLLSSLTLS